MKIRIITWNVFQINPRIKALIAFVLSKNPDIMCFQEFPFRHLEFLKNIPGYHLAYTPDFLHRRGKHAYICTLSKFPIKSTIEHTYYDKAVHSVLDKLFYKKISGNEELHNAMVINLEIEGKSITIFNSRLSIAIPPNERLAQYENILKSLEITQGLKINIVCGDFNIMESVKYNLATGWMRGYKKSDHFIKERLEFEKISHKFGMKNIFRGISTYMVTRRPSFQMDHILVPENIEVVDKEVSKWTYGSDHKMLLADIEI